MDMVPFLELNMLDIKEHQLAELKKFCKSNFNSNRIFSTAEELKYTGLIKQVLQKELESPSEGFVRYVLNDIYEGQKNQKVIDKFTPIVKKSFSSLVTETVNQKISSALNDTPVTEPAVEEQDNTDNESKIVTTQSEIESFYIIRGLLAGIVPIEDIVHRDTESYFAILYQDNNRKPICCLNLDTKKKQLLIPDENKNFTRYYIDSLNDIYNYKDLLIEALKRYL